MTSFRNEYDINQYTDEELYNILGLNHPTDRELEAKIIMLINKYSNIQNEDGYRIAIFYQNIYKHFFDIQEEEEEQEENIFEGFANNPGPPPNKLYTVIDNPNPDLTQNTYLDKNGNTSTTPNIIATQQFDYSKNPSGTNPLLKQTIKRIISIDSQFRNKQFQPLATNYTFNLSEPLKDVVSLKLYSINIPYTWYTVSKAYGANLIYLKGNTTGIDNGLHDYPISIPPGNYSSSDFVNYINKSIGNLMTTYTDVSFGQTAISYDSPTTRMTFTIDIQKIYNESYYQVFFSNPQMASYLGFNTNYNINNFISNNVSVTQNIYNINSSNNYFIVHRYIPTIFPNRTNIEYNSKFNSIIKSYKIYLCENKNTNYILLTDGSYSNIDTYVNNALSNPSNPFYNSSIVYENTYWSFTINLDRKKMNPTIYPNEKICVELPNSNLWLSDTTNTSFFNFDSYINDLSIITASKNIITNLIYISPNTTIFKFKCIRPQYTNGYNDVSFILNSTYNATLAKNVYSGIANQITSLNQNSVIFNNITVGEINETNITNFNMIINLSKTFNTNNYKIIITNPSSVLCKYYGFTYNTVYDLSSTNIIKSTYKYIYQYNTTLDTNYLFTFLPNETNNGNINDISYNMYLIQNNNTYNNSNYSLDDLTNILNSNNNIKLGLTYQDNNKYNQFNTNIFSIGSQITNTEINPSNNLPTASTYAFTFTYNIINTMTQNDYELDISYNGRINNNTADLITNEINPIKYFGLNLSYKLTNNNIIGNKNISTNLFVNSRDSTISFIINPTLNLYGINIDSNNFVVTIPNGSYYQESLLNIINTNIQKQIANNKSLNSSFISTFFSSKIINNQIYCYFYTNINIIYTSKDYKLVFFDPYSFIKCVATASSISNASWDTTLGWTLGYHDFVDYKLNISSQTNNQYYLTSTNGNYTYNSSIDTLINQLEYKTLVNLTGDTTVSVNVFNYFLIVLDDFIQNHLNDGLITISKPETQIPAQSYASMANKVCDPVTGQIVSLSTSNGPTNKLSQKQLYALNAIQIANKINYNLNYSKGPYVQDIFGIVPIKPPSATGQTYVEFGGTLQNQERQYFGPVNIHRMSIQLVNDKGDIVDLNGSDWSFSLVCEQLYNSTSAQN